MQEEISFGIWLRKQRHALDLTRQAFADQVGCAEVTLRRIERGTLKPSKQLASILLEKLGIPEIDRPQWIAFARGLSGFPSSSTPSSIKSITNLPAPLTTFIGREREQSDVIRLITKHRLVTLTGSGGVGKTRLSIKVGEQITGDYLNGVWLVELASIRDPSYISSKTALTFGLREEPRRSIINRLCEYLRERKMLLILDNCEHLVNSCAHFIFVLLSHCPHIRVLVTSREALGVTGEAIYRVPSLGVPEAIQKLNYFRKYESVRLFEDRAQLVRYHFSLTSENIRSVAQICQRLDGIPLAIELAAAKAAIYSTEQIAGQLQESFDLLAHGSRTALPRHQTLHAAINWSYNLLSPAEQVLFGRLSVFVGGWTVPAAESVCSGGSIQREDIPNLLEQLTNKSLVITEEVGYEAHGRMLGTIRQYAREKLVESGEYEVVRGRHLDFFLLIALRFEQEVHGSQASDWMLRVNSEHDNLHEAMNWAGESGQASSGLRLGYALHYYWLTYGYWSLGRELLEQLLARPEVAGHTRVRADALNLAGDLATQQGDLKAARVLLEESKSIGMELGESGKPCLGWSLMLLGQSLMSHDTATAQQELDQSLTLLQEAGEPWRFAIAVLVRGQLAESQKDMLQAGELFNKSLTILQDMGDTMTSALPMQALGRIWYLNGEYDTASVYLQRALKIHRAWEKDIYTPEVLGHLGAIALFKGNHEHAAGHFDERLSMTRELKMNKANIANALCDLGIALGYLGNYVRAAVVLREGLELSREIGNTYLIAACLTGLASMQQQSHRAARILAAAKAVFEQSGEFINPLYRVEHERAENKMREALDAKDFAKFSAEGYMMTAEQAVALALDTVEKM